MIDFDSLCDTQHCMHPMCSSYVDTLTCSLLILSAVRIASGTRPVCEQASVTTVAVSKETKWPGETKTGTLALGSGEFNNACASKCQVYPLGLLIL